MEYLFPMIWISMAFTSTWCEHTPDFPLCSADRSELCFTAVATPQDWFSADDFCSQAGPGSVLPYLRSRPSEMSLTVLAAEQGWSAFWVSGWAKGQTWRWYSHQIDFAYQGCYQDNPNRRDLPNNATGPDVTSPSSCIAKCRSRGYALAGVQLSTIEGSESRSVLCHCSDQEEFGNYGILFDEACATPCPDAPPSGSGDNLLDTRCGDVNHQLIFIVEGTTFHSLVPEDQRGEGDCVLIDRHPKRRWKTGDCNVRKAYLCHHTKLDEAECKTIPNAVWSGGLCIEAVRGPKSWYDALEACAETPGTLLAFLPDASVAAGLELEPDVAYWIDLTVRQWEWFSFNRPEPPEPVSYFNWGKGQPAKGEGLDCLSLRQPQYKWFTEDCERKLPFFCFHDSGVGGGRHADTPTAPPPPSGGPDPVVLGVAIGAAVALLISIGTISFVCYRRCKRTSPETNGASSSTNMAFEDKMRRLPSLPPGAPGSTSARKQNLAQFERKPVKLENEPVKLGKRPPGKLELTKSNSSGYVIPIDPYYEEIRSNYTPLPPVPKEERPDTEYTALSPVLGAPLPVDDYIEIME